MFYQQFIYIASATNFNSYSLCKFATVRLHFEGKLYSVYVVQYLGAKLNSFCNSDKWLNYIFPSLNKKIIQADATEVDQLSNIYELIYNTLQQDVYLVLVKPHIE